MKKSVLLLFSLAVLFASVAQVHAARPLSTDDAGVVDRGSFEYEFGFEMAKSQEKEYSFCNCLKAGLWQGMDAGLELPFICIDSDEGDDEGGLSDIALSLKYNFWANEGPLSLSARFDFKTDTGDDEKGLGSGDKDYALTMIASWEFEYFTAHFNMGYTFAGEADDVFAYSAALEKPLNEKCTLVCEISSETDFSGDFDDHPCRTLLGMNYQAFENIVFDLGVGVPFSEASPDYTITGGLTAAF